VLFSRSARSRLDVRLGEHGGKHVALAAGITSRVCEDPPAGRILSFGSAAWREALGSSGTAFHSARKRKRFRYSGRATDMIVPGHAIERVDLNALLSHFDKLKAPRLPRGVLPNRHAQSTEPVEVGTSRSTFG